MQQCQEGVTERGVREISEKGGQPQLASQRTAGWHDEHLAAFAIFATRKHNIIKSQEKSQVYGVPYLPTEVGVKK